MAPQEIPLDSGYREEFDTVSRDEWYGILDQFADANLYQTWCYDAVRWGEKNISHLVLRRGDTVVAAAQARLVRLPIIGRGGAYIRWGPLWQRMYLEIEESIFRNAVRALRNEYVCRRRMILRILPVLYDTETSDYRRLLIGEGFKTARDETRGRTLILELNPTIEDLRKGLDQKWRNCLNSAERKQLEILDGTEDALFEEFTGLYREMLQRKQFKEPNDINEFRRIQMALPEEYKMHIFICRSGGKSTAGAICACVGDTGIYLFGATNDSGMENKGSYLIQWKVIQRMKANGCQSYNLNGINPHSNPGGYHFKAGIAGKKGKDVYYIGCFNCYSGAMSEAVMRGGKLLLPLAKRIAGLRQAQGAH